MEISNSEFAELQIQKSKRLRFNRNEAFSAFSFGGSEFVFTNELPVFGVFGRIAGRESAQRRERFEFDERACRVNFGV